MSSLFGLRNYFKSKGKMIVASKALHPTSIPLRFITAGRLGRWQQQECCATHGKTIDRRIDAAVLSILG
jgi:hypothetical protein